LFLSWGPPHDPYQTAPARFRALFKPEDIQLRPNVPEALAGQAREKLAGYYAHGAALDACFGQLLDTLARTGQDRDTIVIFTSDHGDLAGSQGLWNKQWPHEESIRVPFLMRLPASREARTVDLLLDAPDLMPTLLALCGAPVPPGLEGRDFSEVLLGREPADPATDAVLACYTPFHQMLRKTGGWEYRGLRTLRYTYVINPQGPWFLFDNEADPFQLRNLVNTPETAAIQAALDRRLRERLKALRDPFEPGPDLLARLHIRLNEAGDVFYE
jgi:arylsulfatase A-like enzyme